MLSKLANLSPGRCYYPRYKRIMQTVEWNNKVSFLSQHGHFVTAVRALLRQADQAQIFYPDSELHFPLLDKIDEHLLQRDNIRSALFRVAGFGAEDHTVLEDQKYAARDRELLSPQADRASTMSCLLVRDYCGLSEPALSADCLWQRLCAFDLVHGPQMPIEAHMVKYDATLLQDGCDSVLQRLPAFYRWLSSPLHSQRYKFSVMMWLSTMAFASDVDVPVLQTVAMFLKAAALAQVIAPDILSFHPVEGKTCSSKSLRAIVAKHRRQLNECPEHNLTRRPNEKLKNYNKRRNQEWQHAGDSAVADFVAALIDQ